jgi:ubiquitin carboxyl-terminal hydrolase 36/42
MCVLGTLCPCCPGNSILQLPGGEAAHLLQLLLTLCAALPAVLLCVQVRAYKRISIDCAPNVLTVHLKRFDFFGRGHKVSKRVEFGLELDLGPYMTQHLQRQHHHKHHKQQQQHGQQNGLHAHLQQQHPHLPQQQHGAHHHGHHQPLMYDLYAVLVHLGHSLHSGHYVCYVKAGNGIWHICDDHRVAQVSQRVVESQQAYILFYIKRQPKGASAAAAGPLPAAVAAAAQNAAVAANRLQQQQKQQPVGASDSTKTPLAGAAAAALGQAQLVSTAAAAAGLGQQQQQQRGAAAGLAADQSGSLSAAEGVRKVATSSTESTANASPGGTPAG